MPPCHHAKSRAVSILPFIVTFAPGWGWENSKYRRNYWHVEGPSDDSLGNSFFVGALSSKLNIRKFNRTYFKERSKEGARNRGLEL